MRCIRSRTIWHTCDGELLTVQSTELRQGTILLQIYDMQYYKVVHCTASVARRYAMAAVWSLTVKLLSHFVAYWCDTTPDQDWP